MRRVPHFPGIRKSLGQKVARQSLNRQKFLSPIKFGEKSSTAIVDDGQNLVLLPTACFSNITDIN
ncbi:MAG: hypothetical protein ACK5Y2_08705 [Bdellovibrionales bacterium]